jgi:hypothetical protein
MSMAWAKCPSLWARVKNTIDGSLEDEQDDGSAYLPDNEKATAHPSGEGYLPGLSHLRWRQHKGGATAAIMVLFALAIKSNLDQKKDGQRINNQVIATYEDLMALTNLSRGPIAKGLELLRELGAITTKKNGNGCIYTLEGIDVAGGYCELPQDHLLDGQNVMRRLKGLHIAIKNRSSLDAMKLYMLLLAFRERKFNVARVSYVAIRQYTGMRKEEISVAVQLLMGAHLIRLARDEEVPLKGGQHRHNRYVITGLLGRVM